MPGELADLLFGEETNDGSEETNTGDELEPGDDDADADELGDDDDTDDDTGDDCGTDGEPAAGSSGAADAAPAEGQAAGE